jgi:apolipoprotein N-acyltransferase
MPVFYSRTVSEKSFLGLSVLLAFLSAVLLDFPFPMAGPLPPWRSVFAWFALVPLLVAVLMRRNVAARNYYWRSALVAYFCGVLWYVLNCYWIYQTMTQYAQGVSPAGAVGMLLLFSAVLGVYFALFGLALALLRRSSGGILVPLLFAPFLWTALELLAAHVTSVPWDQLGYSQVDNLMLTHLAPVTGNYGISFVIVAVNALLAATLLTSSIHIRLRIGTGAALLILLLQMGLLVSSRPAATSRYAVLLQPNLDVGTDNLWIGPEWDEHASWMLEQSLRTCTPSYIGMPERNAPLTNPPCGRNISPPGLVSWPEAQSPFSSDSPRLIALMRTLATTTHAPIIAGMLGHDQNGTFNSAIFTAPSGAILGRYDKIHLVPFGEYIPYRNLFFFAHKLTQQLVDLQRGKARKVFRADGHGFGIFICYESIFASEVRQFALNGADVFVNISDDGWYGDTSAPWQHLNMARMRAIENHRWILLDTNNGVTTAIDPQGRVTYSAPRKVDTSLVVRYGYENDLTFYTRYGDVFAWSCGIIVLGVLLFSVLSKRRDFRKGQVPTSC